MDMRGLAHFIQDIRNATSSREEEQHRVDVELAKIRAKFKSTKTMSTYDRKKYVCKLMFITMLGYPVDFGHIEGIKLLGCSTPAEKLIGYLSMTVFLHENHELLTLSTHMVYLDLISQKEFNASLALTAIGNTGGKDFAEVMADGVLAVVMGENVGRNCHIRKKALLTYLHLFRKYPEMVDLDKTVPVVGELIEHPQLSVSMCAMTYLSGVYSEEKASLFASIPEKVINVLARIILERRTEPEYIYYGVPAPWVQAKAVQFLQRMPIPTDSFQRNRIFTILRKVLKATDKVIRDAQAQQRQRGTLNRISSMNAVLVEVVTLVIKWNTDAKMMADCMDVLNNFVVDKRDSNIRYLGLALLSQLSYAALPGFDFVTHCRQYQQQIVVALHDPDLSIRKRALEVTCNMCNESNVRGIIGELLAYLPVSEHAFREDLVHITALLAERWCKDRGWYMDVMLSLIIHAGNVTPNAIICRIIHVVVNTAAVQKKTATMLFRALKQKSVDDVLVRVAAFVLGEYGYQIAANAESPPIVQFNALAIQLPYVSRETRSVILSTFAKFFNLFDNTALREAVADTLKRYSHSFDAELQQRAVESLGIIESGHDELMQFVLAPLPPFTTSARPIYELCKGRRIGVTSKELLGEPTAPVSVEENGEVNGNENGTSVGSPNTENQKMMQLTSPNAQDETVVAFGTTLPSDTIQKADDSALSALLRSSIAQMPADVKETSRRTQAYFTALLTSHAGPLFTNNDVQLSCQFQVQQADYRLTLRAYPSSTSVVSNFSISLLSTESGLLIQSRAVESTDNTADAAKSLGVTEFAARSLSPFASSPAIRVGYDVATSKGDTQHRILTVSLPVITTHFITKYDCHSEADFISLEQSVRIESGRKGHSYITSIASMGGEPTETQRDHIVSVLSETMKLYVLPVTRETTVLAVGAHTTQPGTIVQYTPVAVRCERPVGVEWVLTVNCIDVVVRDEVNERLRALLHASLGATK